MAELRGQRRAPPVAGARLSVAGQFVISLDFELLWGMRDHCDEASYGDAIMGGRAAIPEMLALFARYDVGATWATVGFLFARDKTELRAMLPGRRPNYRDPRLDPYPEIDRIGDNEAEAPLWYGRSLVERIMATPRQEIATHSFSHYCALEPERDDAAYRADLDAAVAAARSLGVETRSIVFARNQYAAADIATARAAGIAAYRGNPLHPIYRPAGKAGQGLVVRGRRLADALVPTGIEVSWQLAERAAPPYNIPASRFLRPAANGAFDALRLRRILGEMDRAAASGRLYHLWWHPHNFGRRTGAMLRDLETILAHYRKLADRHGWESLTMAECAARGLSAPLDFPGTEAAS